MSSYLRVAFDWVITGSSPSGTNEDTSHLLRFFGFSMLGGHYCSGLRVNYLLTSEVLGLLNFLQRFNFKFLRRPAPKGNSFRATLRRRYLRTHRESRVDVVRGVALRDERYRMT